MAIRNGRADRVTDEGLDMLEDMARAYPDTSFSVNGENLLYLIQATREWHNIQENGWE